MTLNSLDEYRALVGGELDRRWPESADSVDSVGTAGTADELMMMARYALLPPGKLLRPALALVSAELVGGDPELVLPAALGLEYLHTATLAHDDVIDSDDVRRGRPSVPAAFGLSGAILTGDHLLFTAFSAITQCRGAIPADRVTSAVTVLAAAGSDLCRGQLLESELAGDPEARIDRYLEMTRLKTGALFRAVCESGAVLAGADPPVSELLGSYGEHLGVAFQIRDDLLGYLTPDREDPHAVSDLANGRPTLAVLLAFQGSDQAGRRQLAGALAAGSRHRGQLDMVRDLLRDSGALTRSRQIAAEHAEHATTFLAGFGHSRSRTILTGLAQWTGQVTP